MAFMVPVMKKEFDIYKTGRSRRSSECSSSNASCRSRKISECRSECPSLSTSPGSDYIGNVHNNNGLPHHHHPNHHAINHHISSAAASAGAHGVSHRSQSIPVNRNLSRTMLSGSQSSRPSSRTSQSSLITSPTKGPSSGCSPPKPTAGSQGSLNKFHQRLVDKLRKSLRKARSEDRS